MCVRVIVAITSVGLQLRVVLYGYCHIKGSYGARVFENRVLKGMVWPQGGEVTVGRMK